MNNVEEEIDNIIDNFNLKPITKGLGFHHSLKEVKDVKRDLKKNSNSLKKDLENRISQLGKKSLKKTSIEVPPDMGELTPFYSKEVSETQEKNLSLGSASQNHKKEALDLTDVTMLIRFFAWAIDIFVLFILMISMFSAIVFFADLPLNHLNFSVLSGDLLLSFTLMSLMVYIFYFSFLDKTLFSTPGKNLFDIRVVSFSGGKLSLVKVFFRTCASLVSILFLGLPILLKLYDGVTETKVVKK